MGKAKSRLQTRTEMERWKELTTLKEDQGSRLVEELIALFNSNMIQLADPYLRRN